MLEIINPLLDHSTLERRPRFPEILRCSIRILIISDELLVYVTEDGFGLTELVDKSLKSAGTGVGFQITTAYRPVPGEDREIDERFDNPPGRVVDFPDYRLTETRESETGRLPLRSLDGERPIWNYDQVWLMGFSGYVSAPEQVESLRMNREELEVLTAFMNDGGGVFAAGDHEDLGVLLAGDVPRVRSMRKWYWYAHGENEANASHDPVRAAQAAGLPEAPPGDTADRIDTTLEGPTAGFAPSDEADITPQTIYPVLFDRPENPALPGIAHPLLGKPGGVIEVMPDHMHEGDCIVPKDLSQPALPHESRFGDEYPPALDPAEPGDRVRPSLIAFGGSRALGTQPRELFGPFKGRLFGLICAYEGQRAGVGRVAVQSTWHHMTNRNISGAGYGDDDNPQQDEFTGFYVNGRPTIQLRDIQRYHRNIAYWLYPNTWCLVVAGIYSLRLSFPFLEVLPTEKKLDYAGLWKLGQTVRKALYGSSAPGDAYIIAAQLLQQAVPKIPQIWLRTLQPWEGGSALSLVQVQELVDVLLGSAMNTLGGAVPLSGKRMLDPKMDPAKVRDLVATALTRGAQIGWKQYSQRLKGDAEQLMELMPG